jgi:plasmid maintenance system killer protein
LDVAFSSNHMRTCYEQHREAARAWGQDVAREYIQRVGIMQAVRSFDELRAIRSLRLHPLKGGRAGQHAIMLHGRWRLILTYMEAEQALRVDEVSNHYDD